ncbi:MAG: TolC family outer membrane protein [Pseudomonadales bacterium]|nr:TolC family outer membrane protein [Pseudomonadales bacterium]
MRSLFTRTHAKFRPQLTALLAAFTATAGLALGQNSSADTLLDIYQLALDNDPTLQSAEASYRAGDTIREQARAALLPQLEGNFSYQDSDNNQNASFSLTGEGPTENESESESYSLTLSQNVINLPAIFGYRQSKAIAKQSLLQFGVAEQDLIVRVAEAYFDVLRGIDNLASAKAEEKAIAQQLEQTQQRYEVGLIAITDVHEAQAAYDLAIANRLTEEVSLGIAREALAAITGQAHPNLHTLALDFPVTKPAPADADAWVNFATQNNLSIKLAEQLLAAANENRKVKNFEAAPTVEAIASHNKSDSDENIVPRDPSKSPRDSFRNIEGTTVELRINVPIFSGGARHAERKQAGYERVAEQANLVATKRQVLQDTRSSYLTTVTDTARVQARKRAITSAQSALDATEAGYDAGTRNIVDLLNAQRDLYRAQRDYANTRYDYVINSLRLKQAAGTISAKDINDINQWLRTPNGVSISNNPA